MKEKEKDDRLSFTPFAALDKLKAARPAPPVRKKLPSAPPARRDEHLAGKEDAELFLKEMASVREIKEFREIEERKAPRAKPPAPQPDHTVLELRRIVEGTAPIRISDTGEYIEWTSPDINREMSRRLHRGEFAVQDAIDLHGMGLEEAREEFSSFITHAMSCGYFCVKIVHGRGLRSPHGPVLKEAVKLWLSRMRSSLWAYASAKPRDGGLGATYVILRKKKSAGCNRRRA